MGVLPGKVFISSVLGIRCCGGWCGRGGRQQDRATAVVVVAMGARMLAGMWYTGYSIGRRHFDMSNAPCFH